MRMMILMVVALAGCASPAPDFIGAARQDVMLDGIRFSVFHRGNQAEVIRMGYLTRRARDAVPELMYQAAEVATGCRAVSGSLQTRLPGDTGEGRVALKCQDSRLTT